MAVGNFRRVFGDGKPVIAMVHFGALPGSPLYDAAAGLDGLVEGARKDLAALQAAGFDAVMFGNENDRPYEFTVDTASTATMAYVIGRLRAEITRAVRRQRAVGPDEHRWRSRRRPARPSCARSSPAPTPPTWGRGRRTPARRCAIATGSARTDLALLYNVSAEFAYSLDQRQPRRPGAQRGLLEHSRRDPGLRRDHRRGGGDVATSRR